MHDLHLSTPKMTRRGRHVGKTKGRRNARGAKAQKQGKRGLQAKAHACGCGRVAATPHPQRQTKPCASLPSSRNRRTGLALWVQGSSTPPAIRVLFLGHADFPSFRQKLQSAMANAVLANPGAVVVPSAAANVHHQLERHSSSFLPSLPTRGASV